MTARFFIEVRGEMVERLPAARQTTEYDCDMCGERIDCGSNPSGLVSPDDRGRIAVEAVFFYRDNIGAPESVQIAGKHWLSRGDWGSRCHIDLCMPCARGMRLVTGERP